MRPNFVLPSILYLVLALPCLAQSSENKPAPNQFGEINLTPLKDLVGKIFEMCNSGGTNPSAGAFSAAFEVDPGGSIPQSSIRITASSGSKEIDRTGVYVLLLIGESHILGVVSGLPSRTIEIKVADNIYHLSIITLTATAEEARGKSEQLRFLLGVVAMSQRTKNPSVSELLSYLTVKGDDKRVTADLALPCGRTVEMLRMLKSK